MKIAIIGYSGSGKSTLAKYLSNTLNLNLLYLDTVQFEENWKVRDSNIADRMVLDFLNENDNWVIEGVYKKRLFNERLNQANYIIFLNFNRVTCYNRAKKRFKEFKGSTRDSMSPGCCEKFDLEFKLWVLIHGRKTKFFNEVKNKYSDKIIEIKNQKNLDVFKLNIEKYIR